MGTLSDGVNIVLLTRESEGKVYSLFFISE